MLLNKQATFLEEKFPDYFIGQHTDGARDYIRVAYKFTPDNYICGCSVDAGDDFDPVYVESLIRSKM